MNDHLKKPAVWMWLIFFVGLVIRLYFVWQPIPVLIGKHLPDDAYYYFSIAKNIIGTGSVSIDGLHTTNGFHPLWLLLIIPIFSLQTASLDLPIHIALTLAAVLDGLAVPIIWFISKKLTNNEVISLFSAFCYALNPIAIYQGANGLETGLAQFVLVSYWFLLIRWIDHPRSIKAMLAASSVGGLMLLARNDTIFFFIAGLMAWLLFTGIKEGWKSVLIAMVIAILINVPWYLISGAFLSSWVQDSGFAVPYAIQERWTMNHGFAVLPRLIEGIKQIFMPAYWLRGDPTGLPLFVGIALWIAVLSVLGLYWMKSREFRSMAIILPAIFAGLLLIIFHSGLRWYPRPWYFFILSAAWPISTAMAISTFSEPLKILRFAYPTVFFYFVLAGMLFWQFGYFPWQADFLMASNWLKENTPQDSRIASFNAGIYSYYSKRIVVNLDGVVNHEAYEAVQDKKVLRFLIETNIQYLIDSDMALTSEYGPFLGDDLADYYEEIYTVPSRNQWAIGPLRVYQLKASIGE